METRREFSTLSRHRLECFHPTPGHISRSRHFSLRRRISFSRNVPLAGLRARI